MIYLKALAVCSVLGSVAWVIVEPGFEPSLAVTGSVSTLVALFVMNRNKQQNSRQKQVFSVNSSVNNAGGNVNSASQSTSGPNSPNFSNIQGDVSVTINTGKTKLDIPSFDFSLQPSPGWRGDPMLGEKFNDTMAGQLNNTVYLSIILPKEMTENVGRDNDEYGRFIFTVRNNEDDFNSGGAEYLVHLSKSEKTPLEFKGDVALLSGYFKIYDINGPRQGYMSVNLRSVDID